MLRGLIPKRVGPLHYFGAVVVGVGTSYYTWQPLLKEQADRKAGAGSSGDAPPTASPASK